MYMSNQTCSRCNKGGHVAATCNAQIAKDISEPEVIEIAAMGHPMNVVCQICSMRGHTACNCQILNNWQPGIHHAQIDRVNLFNNYDNGQSYRNSRSYNKNNGRGWNNNNNNGNGYVIVSSKEFKNNSSFMLDAGAKVSVIKITKISNNAAIDTKKKILLKGITDEIIPSLGAIYARINNITPITLHLVSGDFPILQDGIIGNEFFMQDKGDISYRTKSLKLNNQTIKFETIDINNYDRSTPPLKSKQKTSGIFAINDNIEFDNRDQCKIIDGLIDGTNSIVDLEKESTIKLQIATKIDDSIEINDKEQCKIIDELLNGTNSLLNFDKETFENSELKTAGKVDSIESLYEIETCNVPSNLCGITEFDDNETSCVYERLLCVEQTHDDIFLDEDESTTLNSYSERDKLLNILRENNGLTRETEYRNHLIAKAIRDTDWLSTSDN
uniref:CCHC-type domain-containing protein n=1 Tax=Trichogramma kaykai TaxID=54128 RepID=A0ABD2W7P5_9HYME